MAEKQARGRFLPKDGSGAADLERDARGRYEKKKREIDVAKAPRRLLARGVLGSRLQRAPVMRSSLPQVIRDLRLKARLSVKQCAALAGISHKTLEKYESGEAFNMDDGPAILRLERVVRACGARMVIEYDHQAPAASARSSSFMHTASEPAGRKLNEKRKPKAY